ncbi:putative phosphoglycerate mutase [Colletotrichum zoysiae]|uniref:Phosphoglycerate mutase n=1 Tax=Colletotrichum zoysiae TaxID=1216348 RepID=A0AAD9HPW4_9PEZI|nr:putative phosphoglycerate mutase [Colletotrichum zoysiae]
MSDRESQTPRVFLVRHGETEWAKQGRYTGITNIDLTPAGVAQVSSTARSLVGAGKLVDPTRLAKIIVSPRKRAIHTLELLLPSLSGEPEVTLTEEIAEWDYGDYEGMKTDEIRELRRQRELDANRPWNIWSDGCEGGESKDEVTKRLDRIIVQIREIQRPYMNGEKPVDVLLVAHGLILRCFWKRWLGLPVDFDLSMIFAPGAVAVLSYKENDIEKPTFHLGVALPHGVATQ